ncbi:hypothetical protein V6N12_055255 [Hibiscus sabdariffa]|uniref:Ig-like domain-containing protein n=1 Tax=Hibiscus sabdariffa TaxID=183260 RepID=A0ABR1ZJ44_9ROSI
MKASRVDDASPSQKNLFWVRLSTNRRLTLALTRYTDILQSDNTVSLDCTLNLDSQTMNWASWYGGNVVMPIWTKVLNGNNNGGYNNNSKGSNGDYIAVGKNSNNACKLKNHYSDKEMILPTHMDHGNNLPPTTAITEVENQPHSHTHPSPPLTVTTTATQKRTARNTVLNLYTRETR